MRLYYILIGGLFLGCITISTVHADNSETYKMLTTYCKLGDAQGDITCDQPYNFVGPQTMKLLQTLDERLFANDLTRSEIIEIRRKVSSLQHRITQRKSAADSSNIEYILILEIVEHFIEYRFDKTAGLIATIPHTQGSFDGCQTVQWYLDNADFDTDQLSSQLLQQDSGAGGTYADLPETSYTWEQAACYSSSLNQLVFFFGGARTCRNVYRYDIDTNTLNQATVHEGYCPNSFGKRDKILDYIPIYGYIDDGMVYTGKYFYQEDIVTE